MDWLTLDTWVTSDHHWEHRNIGVYSGRPDNHFELMRERWIDRVGKDEPLLHLGDLVCFGDHSKHEEWIRGLPGRKFLLRGNHDKHPKRWYEAAGFTVIGNAGFSWLAPDGKLVFFSHEPDYEPDLEWDINIHGHIHTNPYYMRTPLLDYRNISIEMTEYAPVRLRDVLYGDAGGRRATTPSSALVA